MPISRSELRQLIDRMLRTSSALDAFLLDYFPHTFKRLALGMDRTTRVNMLFEDEAVDSIVAGLQTAFPELRDQHIQSWLPQPNREPQWQRGTSEEAVRPVPGLPLGEIFLKRGTPSHTYVEPAQIKPLKAALRTTGKSVLVEGPAGIGKTSLVNRVLEDPDLRLSASTVMLATGAEPDRIALDELVRSGLQPGRFVVVDDFHHLDSERKKRLALLIKVLADRSRVDAKLILIGINPLGDSLLSHLPDAIGCFERIQLTRQPPDKLHELVKKGEDAARLRFLAAADFVERTEGSFALLQWLLLEAAQKEGLYEVPDEPRVVRASFQDVKDAIMEELRARFGALLSTFAGYDLSQSAPGACRRLLQELAASKAAIVRLEEVRNRDGGLASTFDWLMGSKLGSLIDANPGLGGLFYYHRDVKVLSIEDPFLHFYLRNLSAADFPGPDGQSRTPTGQLVSMAQGTPPVRQGASARVLHLSDLHFSHDDQVVPWLAQLETDLKSLLREEPLSAVVISGDIADTARPEEYQAAARFLRELVSTFKLPTQRVLLVPGNHDVDWEQSHRAYIPRWLQRNEDPSKLASGTFLWLSREEKQKSIAERRDEQYRLRFMPFAELYSAVRGEGYSSEYAEQATIQHFPDENLLVVGFNSAWYTDHAFPDRAGIHAQAFSRALRQVEHTSAYKGCVKLAVMHHPPSLLSDKAGLDAACLEQLAKAGFRLLLHGHVHEADNQGFCYHGDTREGRIEIIGAGTFGGERNPRYPYQYQLLAMDGSTVSVHTRKREKPGGAWKPDARWKADDQGNVASRYTIRM